MSHRSFIRQVALFAVLALCGAAVAAEKQVSDDHLYDTVKRKLANDPMVKGGAFTIEVKDGVVTLRGAVDSEKRKQRAEKLTRKTQGVKAVTNELVIAPGRSQ
jgi:osmotically-inducible protein OsmY